jgi:hypothetical protein
MKIILAGICKNIEKSFQYTQKSFEELYKYITINEVSEETEFKFLIYQNNSTDKTIELLEKFQEKYKDVVIVKNEMINEMKDIKGFNYQGLPSSLELKAKARNKLLEMINSLELIPDRMINSKELIPDRMIDQHFPINNETPLTLSDQNLEDEINTLNKNENYSEEFVIFFDMNMNIILPVNKIFNLINKEEFDAIIIDTHQKLDINYRNKEDDYTELFGPEYIQEYFYHLSEIRENKKIESSAKVELKNVLSSYNGLAIIRRNAMIDLNFTSFPTEYLNDLYKSYLERPNCIKFLEEANEFNKRYYGKIKPLDKFHHNLNKHKINKQYITNEAKYRYENSKKIFEGDILHSSGGTDLATKLIYKADKYDYPEVGEFVSFFLKMRFHGYDRIYRIDL